ncbi:bestrophin family protein [Gemmobacter caeruleus]|uniref:bestrophin family protein n=1 Tax=Gemmobacter caeruleus TaxID=2595004 RepID=UPI0011ECD28A|nr:bestrophin family protein [Gemmobacter caeruleus]
MIIREKPGPYELIFALRGSILPKLWPQLSVIVGLALAIVVWDALVHLSTTPFALFGVALSLFPGFRNNAAYDRWWEARKLAGGLVADSRPLAREADVFIADPRSHHRLLRQVLTFHHLHRCAPLGIAPDAQARTTAGALDAMTDSLATAGAAGVIDGFGALAMTSRIATFAHGLTGRERIATTPLPYVYSMLAYCTSWLYCLLVPLALLDGTGWTAPLFCAIVGDTFLGLAEVIEVMAPPVGMDEAALAKPAETFAKERILWGPETRFSPSVPVQTGSMNQRTLRTKGESGARSVFSQSGLSTKARKRLRRTLQERIAGSP